jgi:hypothetical protein
MFNGELGWTGEGPKECHGHSLDTRLDMFSRANSVLTPSIHDYVLLGMVLSLYTISYVQSCE